MSLDWAHRLNETKKQPTTVSPTHQKRSLVLLQPHQQLPLLLQNHQSHQQLRLLQQQLQHPSQHLLQSQHLLLRLRQNQ